MNYGRTKRSLVPAGTGAASLNSAWPVATGNFLHLFLRQFFFILTHIFISLVVPINSLLAESRGARGVMNYLLGGGSRAASLNPERPVATSDFLQLFLRQFLFVFAHMFCFPGCLDH